MIDQLVGSLVAFVPKLWAGMAIFAGFWLGGWVLERLIRKANERGKLQGEALGLVINAVSVGVLVFGAVTALGTMGVNVSALVAGLGLTGFALGFALRDVLSNLLAGAMILFYKPFKRGENISVNGLSEVSGEVVKIDLRYTVLQQKDKRILVPNATLFNNPVTVFGK